MHEQTNLRANKCTKESCISENTDLPLEFLYESAPPPPPFKSKKIYIYVSFSFISLSPLPQVGKQKVDDWRT